MQQILQKGWRQKRWGILASVLVHVAVVAIFLFRLPEQTPQPKEPESISVDLVSPPEEKSGGKPAAPAGEPSPQDGAEAPPPAPAAAKQPQAFESASPEGEKEASAQASEFVQPKTDRATPPVPKPVPEKPVLEETEPKPQETVLQDKPTPSDTEPLKTPPAQEGDFPAPQQKEAATPVAPAPAPKPETPKAEPEKPQDQAKLSPEDKRLEPAKQLFSENALSDPHMRQALGQLPPNRRIVQMCSIEVLEQIRNARPDLFPDALVPFSAIGGLISNYVLRANGGAFHSGENWYDVNFRCEANAETTSIISFSFEIGNAVARGDWQRRNLPAQ
jgi:hypothetical protein